MGADIDNLINAATAPTHIWQVTFEYHPDIPELGADGDEVWLFDEIHVAAWEDAQVAIDRAREHVANKEEYSFATRGFRLKGIKLLAEADIQA